jgi:hypothetical protein
MARFKPLNSGSLFCSYTSSATAAGQLKKIHLTVSKFRADCRRRRLVEAAVRPVGVAPLADEGSAASLRLEVVDVENVFVGQQLHSDPPVSEKVCDAVGFVNFSYSFVKKLLLQIDFSYFLF